MTNERLEELRRENLRRGLLTTESQELIVEIDRLRRLPLRCPQCHGYGLNRDAFRGTSFTCGRCHGNGQITTGDLET